MIVNGKKSQLFETGKLFATKRVNAATESNPTIAAAIYNAFDDYIVGNWGKLSQEDKEANDDAVKNNCGRIVARYATGKEDIYIITEADRSSTLILFCDEY